MFRPNGLLYMACPAAANTKTRSAGVESVLRAMKIISDAGSGFSPVGVPKLALRVERVKRELFIYSF